MPKPYIKAFLKESKVTEFFFLPNYNYCVAFDIKTSLVKKKYNNCGFFKVESFCN